VAALEQGRPGQRYILAGDNLPARDLVLTVSNMIGRTPHLVRIPRPLINLAARVSATLARLRGQGRLEFYPDLVGLLDYDWSFSSEKARQELGFQARSIYHTLTDLLSKEKEA
jgi:dihydroflavonol-4-reductase